MQLRYPASAGGANAMTLIDAQEAFRRIGAVEERLLEFVRPPAEDEPLDEGWRPIDPQRDKYAHSDDESWVSDYTVFYWWRVKK